LSWKRKSTEAPTESSKVACDESTPTNMETLVAENPVDEISENMDEWELMDERSDDTHSEGSIDEDRGRLVDPDYQSEDPEDLGGEFTLYTRGGVRRRRKKRTSWERKSTTKTLNKQQVKPRTLINRVHQATQLPTSLVRTTKANPNNEFNKAREGEEEGS
jgi:hypothetical protein